MATLQATTISGVLTVDTGTNTVPTIANSSNTNTGIYRTATNTVSIATNGSQRANITGNGYFTASNLPAFAASDSRTISLSNVDLTTNFYDTIFINNGNHFNASNGRFTAPVAGYYDVSFQTNGTSNGPDQNIRIRRNGVFNEPETGECYNQTGGAGTSGSSNLATFLVFCAAGDYIDVQVATFTGQAGAQHKHVLIYLAQ